MCACCVPAGVIALRDPLVDVRVAAWMLTPDQEELRDSATEIGAKKAAWPLETLLKQRAPGAARRATAGLGPPVGGGAAVAAGRAAAMCAALAPVLLGALRGQGDALLHALHASEMPLVRALAAMQGAGVALEGAVLDREAPRVLAKLAELEALAYSEGMAGKKFNLAASAEVRAAAVGSRGSSRQPAALRGRGLDWRGDRPGACKGAPEKCLRWVTAACFLLTHLCDHAWPYR